MSHEEDDSLRRQLRECLTDPTRKSARGRYRSAYTDARFDERLRRRAALPLREELHAATPIMAAQLEWEQACDLLEHLDLSPRQIAICRRRIEGYTIGEIAAEMNLGERRIYALLNDIKRILDIGLRPHEEIDTPGRSPYYGWQEVFLNSQRR